MSEPGGRTEDRKAIGARVRYVGGRVALLILLLLLPELLARALTWSPSNDAAPKPMRFNFSEATLGDWPPSQAGIVTSRRQTPFYVEFNDAGFRNVDPLNHDAVRVLVLGDSQTFGQYTSAHDTWTSVAQRQWNTAHSSRPVQLLNNGMPGATITDYLAYLKEKGSRLSPDAVLIVFCENDFKELRDDPEQSVRARVKHSSTGVRFEALRRSLGEHSGLYTLLRSAKARLLPDTTWRASPRPAEDVAAADRRAAVFRALTIEAVATARTLGAAVGLIYAADDALGARDPRPREISMSVADEIGLPRLDLTGILDRHDPRDVYLLDPVSTVDNAYPADGHLSRYGHRVAGRAVAEFLSSVLPEETASGVSASGVR